MLRPDFPILTERLVLRPFTCADVDDVWAWQRRPDVVRFLPWEPRDRARSRKSVERMTTEDRLVSEGDCLSLAVEMRATGTVVGEVDLIWVSREHRQGEIGFVVHPDHQRQGIGAEAATAVLRLGFEGLGLHRIVGRCVAGNAASVRLMERLGMRREAHLAESQFFKGEFCDEYVYAILRRNFSPPPSRSEAAVRAGGDTRGERP